MSFIINPNISEATSLPKKFYLEQKYFNYSKEHIFLNSWQIIADTSVFNDCNVFPFTLLPDLINEPLILTYIDNKINCYSNVCTHRAHLVVDKKCQLTKLRCIYHGRTFNLNGTFNSMPGFDNTKNFPTKKDNLPSIFCQKWKNFFFVSLKGKINIDSVLNDISNRIPNYPFSKLLFDQNNSQEWDIDSHWALYCENFLEGFHIPFVHQGLAKEIDVGTYKTILFKNAVLQIATANKDYKVFNNKNSTTDKIYALYYWIFPNLMLNFYSWGLSINIIEPITPSKTRIKFLSYPIKSKKQPSSGNATLNKVEMEDQGVVSDVQKGINSVLYNSGRYSADHEKGVHHFHLLLSHYLNQIMQ